MGKEIEMAEKQNTDEGYIKDFHGNGNEQNHSPSPSEDVSLIFFCFFVCFVIFETK